MKKAYRLLAIMGIVLLFGCTEESIKENTIERDNIEITDMNIAVGKEIKEGFEVPFKIDVIESKILEFNDAAFDKPLKGVRYEISLFSKEEIPYETYSSYEFEIDPKSTLKESLGPIQGLSLADTLNEGYVYSLPFETVYHQDYTQEELENLNIDRDFQVFLNFEGERYPVEFQ
jgi:hypothetical protein